MLNANTQTKTMNITGLPALTDSYENFIWILQEANSAWIVDPGESQGVLDYLTQNQLTPKAILITHNHFDHTDGITQLLEHYPNLKVYGPNNSQNKLIQIGLKEGDLLPLTEAFTLTVMETPGHTADHISYTNQQVLFCGDTLFTGGCGRELGGGYEAFSASLLKIRALPDDLEVYTAHEYTLSNLEFAHYICPENQAIEQRLKTFNLPYPRIHQGAQSSLQLEKKTNPFLQFDQPNLIPKLRGYSFKNQPV